MEPIRNLEELQKELIEFRDLGLTPVILMGEGSFRSLFPRPMGRKLVAFFGAPLIMNKVVPDLLDVASKD